MNEEPLRPQITTLFWGVHKKHLLIIRIIIHVNWNNCREMFL